MVVGLACFTRVTRRPSGLRIKSAMTWTMLMRRFHPHPNPLPSRERGILSVGLACSPAHPPPCGFPAYAGMTGALYCPSGLQIKSAMTDVAHPCEFPACAGMTAVRDAENDGSGCWV